MGFRLSFHLRAVPWKLGPTTFGKPRYKTLFARRFRTNMNAVPYALYRKGLERTITVKPRIDRHHYLSLPALIDVLSQIPNEELNAIKSMYVDGKFKKSNVKKTKANKKSNTLEDDIHDDTSGNFRKALMSLLKASRDETRVVNDDQCRRDAERLYSAGEKRLGTDDSTFIEISMFGAFAFAY
jgi:hypothetical protein